MKYAKPCFLLLLFSIILISSSIYGVSSDCKCGTPSSGCACIRMSPNYWCYCDSTPPNISINYPQNWIKGGTVTISVYVYDPNSGYPSKYKGTLKSVYIYAGGALVKSWVNTSEYMSGRTFSCDWTPKGTGPYTVRVNATDWKNNSSSKEVTNIRIDNDVPSISLTGLTHGFWYKGGVIIPISFTGTDPTSGIDKIDLYINESKITYTSSGNSYSGTYSWNPTSSNTYNIYATICDKAGNIRSTDTIIVNIDNNAPNVNINTPTNNSYYKSGIPVDINVTGSDVGSGVQKIELFVDGDLKTIFSNTSGKYTWLTPTTPGSHIITAKIYDKVGLTKTSNITVNIDNIYPILGSDPTVSNTINGYINTPIVTWNWSPAFDNETDINEYQVYVEKDGVPIINWVSTGVATGYSHVAEDGATYTCRYKAIDKAGNEAISEPGLIKVDLSVQQITFPKYHALLDGNEMVLSWNPVADFSGIQTYQVALMDNIGTPTGNDIQDAGNQTSKRFTLASLEKDYYFWVRGKDYAGNTGEWTVTGPFPAFKITGPANGLKTNNPVQSFGIEVKDQMNSPDFRYRVCYQSEDNGNINKSAFSFEPLIVTFPEGNWKWWLEIAEYIDGNEEPGSKQTTQPYSLIVDQTKPSGQFTIKSLDDPNKTYSESNPTNMRNVLVSITDLTDTNGIVSSGVKGIYLWNGETTTPPDSIIKEIPTAGIPWELPDQDGIHQINMLIEDNAGNTNLVTYRVALDRVAPGMPQNITHSYTNGVMTFKWAPGEPSADIAQYRGIYILPDGTEKPFSVVPSETKEGQYQIAVGLGANQPVTIKVCSVDRATNESAMAEHLGCTPAEPGKLQFLETGYDTTENKHYLTWKLVEPGITETHQLEYGQVIGEEFLPRLAIVPSADGIFIHDSTGPNPEDKLQPHATYQYRLVAYNKAGDPTFSPVFTQEVQNLPPVKPETAAFAPTGYASSKVIFDYPEVQDYDNDAITYKVKWAEGSDPAPGAYQEAAWDQELGKYTVDLNSVKHGVTYSWYLEIKDSYGGVTTSEVVNFVLDVNNHVITLEKPKSLYTNLKELKVSVKDDLSGIKALEYKFGNGEPRTLELTPGSDGTMVGTIPLVEGQYNLKVTVQDRAGNRSSEDINNLWVDHTPPILDTASIAIDLPTQDGLYLTSGKIPLTWSAGDDSSGIAGLRYWVLSNGETTGQGTYIPLSSGLTEYAHNLEIGPGKPNGQTYRLELAVVDKAGNSSAPYRLPQGFRLDTTPPEAVLTLIGLYLNGAGLYLTDLENLQANLTVNEAESGATASFNLLDGGDGTPITTWDQWDTVKEQAVLTPGGKYRVLARVTNGVGLETEAYSEEFTFDNSAPIITNLSGPEQPLTSGESFILNISATEYETTVDKYRIAIGTQPGATEFTSLLPGNHNGWYELKTNNLQHQIRLEVPEITNGIYYITLEAVNAAGLSARFNQERTLIVNNSLERIVVSDQGPYTMFTDRLTGWWKYNGTKTVTGYRFRILDQDNQVLRNWEITNDTIVTVDQLQLGNNNTYRFEVQAIFEGNLNSESGFSPGVTVDNTAPEITELKTPSYTTPNNFVFEWAGNDDCSGISRVLAAVGTDYNQSDVTKGWVEVTGNNVKLSRDINGEPIVFDSENTKRYYLTLRLVNGAGLTAEKAAPAIVVDNTPPPTPVVYDQGGFINTKPEQPLEAHWFWSETDPESGCSYQWTILKYGEKVNPLTEWHDGDDTKRISLTMDDFRREHGETYYIAVKATNGAGLSSIGYSDGIMVDATAPYLLKVKVLDATNQSGDEEINYITSTNKELRLWIDSYDPQSDVAYYLYAWNTLEEVDQTERSIATEEPISILNPDLVQGAINIFLGETVNQAGITSPPGYSTGIVVDSEAPVIKNVRGGISGNNLLFDWDVETSASPIVWYEYAFVNEFKVNSITAGDWKKAADNSLDRRLVLDATAYPDGRYCLVVRGYNAAGTYSRQDAEHHEWGISNVITLDRTAPEITTAVFPRYADEVVKFSVSAMDRGSGIAGYQYALGTATNQFQFSGGWIELDSQESTVNVEIGTGSELVLHNTGVYVTVRVKDKVGLWSTPKVSGKIIIDHTKPEKPVVTYSRYTTNKLLLTGIQYQASDPESGLVNYRVGLVTEIGGAWLVTKEEQVELTSEGKPVSINLPINAPGLTEAGTYYLALQVQNGTGDWSEIGYSEMITVDSIKPVLTFTHAGETLVINEPPLNVEYILSEDAQVKLIITGADGIAKEETVTGAAGVNQYIFNETKPQTYIIAAIAIDKAGNVGDETEQTKQTVRVNKPPVVSLPGELKATIGRTITFTADVSDPDGEPGDTFIYEWIPGDGSPVLSGANPTHKYIALGEYVLTLTVIDKDGGKVTVTSIVKVGNTTSGELAVDETWSGIHYIYGDVIVPEGIKLTIMPGTEVIADGKPGEIQLKVKGVLIAGSGTVFRSVNKTPTGWKGIYVIGQASFDGVTVSNAERGLAISGSEVTVNQCVFRENHLGIHVINARPLIKNTVFESNAWYGVKEDKGGRPILIECTFIGNKRNYYHQTMTSISVKQINDLPENFGNK